jgi:hypothetical protein
MQEPGSEIEALNMGESDQKIQAFWEYIVVWQQLLLRRVRALTRMSIIPSTRVMLTPKDHREAAVVILPTCPFFFSRALVLFWFRESTRDGFLTSFFCLSQFLELLLFGSDEHEVDAHTANRGEPLIGKYVS